MDLHQNGPSPWPKSNHSGWPEDQAQPTPEATMIPGLGKLVNSCEKCSLGRVSCVQSATKFPVVGSTDKYSLAARIRTRPKMWRSSSWVKAWPRSGTTVPTHFTTMPKNPPSRAWRVCGRVSRKVRISATSFGKLRTQGSLWIAWVVNPWTQLLKMFEMAALWEHSCCLTSIMSLLWCPEWG